MLLAVSLSARSAIRRASRLSYRSSSSSFSPILAIQYSTSSPGPIPQANRQRPRNVSGSRLRSGLTTPQRASSASCLRIAPNRSYVRHTSKCFRARAQTCRNKAISLTSTSFERPASASTEPSFADLGIRSCYAHSSHEPLTFIPRAIDSLASPRWRVGLRRAIAAALPHLT